MKISLKKTIQFKNLSKDFNLIHYDRKYSSNFFFKSPIIHGINISLMAISKYLKIRNVEITSMKINFLHFILVDEKIFFKILKNKIEVYNNVNKKLEIYLKVKENKKSKKNTLSKKIMAFFNFKKNFNSQLIKELLFISKFIGSNNPGNGSLIQSIKITYSCQHITKRKILVKKITKQIFNISYSYGNFEITIIANKLVPFNSGGEGNKINKKTLLNIKNKKILIFGPSSDLARRLLMSEIKKNCKIYTYSFRISNNQKNIKKDDICSLKKLLLNIHPDFIFYFSSPRIINNFKFSKDLFLNYKLVYVDYFHNLLKILKKHSIKAKIFYPSSIYLEKSQKHKQNILSHYIKSKELAEKICNNKDYTSFVNVYRLPQFQSRSNYNILGFYEGKKLLQLDNYLNHFFKSK